MGEAAKPASQKRPRDERLDLFRGLTMLIIFVAHVPANSWDGYIPARFGFSSGTELFVFCSGLASSIAFGSVFLKRGLWLGAARIAMRMWQVYWAHIGLVVVLVALASALDKTYAMGLLQQQFGPLMEDPSGALLGLVTLTWQPDFLDILPVYLVILALIPVMMGLRRVQPLLPFALTAALYGLVYTHGINLPGNPWNGAGWFLNPFAWQLVFFLGFFFGMGWLPVPRLRDPRLIAVCAVFLVAAVPLSFWGILQAWPEAQALRDLLIPPTEKSDLHILRVVHFLALAYVVLSAIDPIRTRLDRGIGHVLILIGRQSLATFLASMALARLAGVIADLMGRDALTMAIVNLGGFAALLAIAVVVTWFKSSPWAVRRTEPAVPATSVSEPSPQPAHPAEMRVADVRSRIREVT